MTGARTFDAAVLIPYNSAGKFFLQQRSDSVKRWPGYWGSFGGGVESGEQIEDALRRELQEELRYEVRYPKFIFSQQLERVQKHIFIEAWSGDEVYELDLKESVECGWFNLEEARRLHIISHDLEALEKIVVLLQQ